MQSRGSQTSGMRCRAGHAIVMLTWTALPEQLPGPLSPHGALEVVNERWSREYDGFLHCRLKKPAKKHETTANF